jgi:hypothetical protein
MKEEKKRKKKKAKLHTPIAVISFLKRLFCECGRESEMPTGLCNAIHNVGITSLWFVCVVVCGCE